MPASLGGNQLPSLTYGRIPNLRPDLANVGVREVQAPQSRDALHLPRAKGNVAQAAPDKSKLDGSNLRLVCLYSKARLGFGCLNKFHPRWLSPAISEKKQTKEEDTCGAV